MDQCFNVLDKLAKSKFRSRFKLRTKELEYIKDKGLDKVLSCLGLFVTQSSTFRF